MDYTILKPELSICRLPAEAPIPQPGGGFFSVTRTCAEISVICENAPLDSVRIDAGWTALEIAGPLDFTLTGILASFAGPLAASGIPIFAISTFDTDYILVKTVHLQNAVQALTAAGHCAKIEGSHQQLSTPKGNK